MTFVIKVLARCLLFFAMAACGLASAQSFNGEWDWNDAPGSKTFSIYIKQHGNRLEGQYCAVAQNGNKIDCEDDGKPNVAGIIDEAEQSSIVDFYSFFGAQSGKALLRISKGRLIWHIIESPKGGEFYAPQNAILDRR